LDQAKSADPEVAVRRQLGLRLLITTRIDQTAADVQTAIGQFSPHFTVEPLFPEPTFQKTAPGEAPHWSDSVFLAVAYGVAFADVTENAWDLARQVQHVGGFVSVAPEFPITAPLAARPEDAGIAGDEPGERWGWEREAMRVEAAWDEIRKGGRLPGTNVVIGHPDCGYREHSVWDKGNLDTKSGRSFWPNEDPSDAKERPGAEYPGHGLATASVMVAPLPLKEGTVTGVAPHSVVIPIRCNDTVKIWFTTEAIVTRGVRYAMERKCRVISISMGGLYQFGGPHPGTILGRTIQEAIDADIIVVAAAGQNIPFDLTVMPANLSRVIGVAGIEKTARRYQAWGYSARVPYGSITISAPARTVTKAAIDGSYNTSEGTSYATAFVAGVAALWLSHHFEFGYPRNVPLRAAQCFRNHVLETRFVPEGFDSWFIGIIDAYRLMVSPPNPHAAPKDEIDCASSLLVLLSQLIDPQDPAHLENLVLENLKSGPVDSDEGAALSQEQCLLEIGSILANHPKILTEIVRLKNAGTLSAQSLSSLLAPEASKALRGRLRTH
jgi:hypothetical protein